MSSMVLSGDTSGSITVTVPVVAGSNTITLPASTGTVMVSGNQPAFSANRSTSQSISNATDTVVLFDVEDFDTASAYDTATGKFQPLVAGYYQFNANMQLSANSITLGSAGFRKNGTQLQIIGTSAFTFNSTPYRFSGSALIYLNGSTDYVQVQAYIAGASGQVINAGSYFSASLVRAA